MNNPQMTPQLLNATEAAALLGVGRTRFWQLRKDYSLARVAWSSASRPLYRAEDVLAMRTSALPPAREDGLVDGSPAWIEEMHKRAREAAGIE